MVRIDGLGPPSAIFVVTSSCYSSYLIKLTNHIIIMGGGFDLPTLKAVVLVNYAVILVNIFFIFIIKHGRFNDLGESVMCDKDSLLSL